MLSTTVGMQVQAGTHLNFPYVIFCFFYCYVVTRGLLGGLALLLPARIGRLACSTRRERLVSDVAAVVGRMTTESLWPVCGRFGINIDGGGRRHTTRNTTKPTKLCSTTGALSLEKRVHQRFYSPERQYPGGLWHTKAERVSETYRVG